MCAPVDRYDVGSNLDMSVFLTRVIVVHGRLRKVCAMWLCEDSLNTSCKSKDMIYMIRHINTCIRCGGLLKHKKIEREGKEREGKEERRKRGRGKTEGGEIEIGEVRSEWRGLPLRYREPTQGIA